MTAETFPDMRPGAESPAHELRACVRDLIGLMALPAVWRGRDPESIAQSLLEALEASLPLAFGHVRLRLPALDVDVMRAGGRRLADGDAGWQAVSSTAAAGPDGALCQTPVGTCRSACVPLGPGGSRGRLTLLSPRDGFPTPTDAVVVRAAAGLADTAIENARVMREQERASRAKDEFLALLGHELRNPLAPITTAVELLRMRAGQQPPRELAVIERQSRHLLRLVDDLLDLARVTRGKVELRRQPTDVQQILSKALEMASPLLDRAGHRVALDVAENAVLDVDPTRAAQVVANLLTNAAKYTPKGGRIVISSRRTEAAAEICVADSGVGIAPELQPRIFDMFVQEGKNRGRGDGGLGIGLALVKSLVELHGGRVAVRSDGAGQGSAFTVTLPLADGTGTRETPAASAASRRELAGCRLLIVDDNVDAALLLADVLEARGAVVQIAHDSFQALARAPSFAPHLALLDIGLPVMDGYELITALRQRMGEAAPRAFALTGYGQDRDRARSRAAGLCGHFVKPVDVDLVVAAITREMRAVPRA